MEKRKILFVCIHNSARSQMAEAFLNELGRDAFIAESAGLEPGTLNPYVVEAMAEIGIDIQDKQTTAVADLIQQGELYNAVITVCDAASAERCPIFPGSAKRIAWSFTDPSGFKGNKEETMIRTRQVRDKIKEQVQQFVLEASSADFWI